MYAFVTWLHGLPGVSAIAALTLGLSCLGPVGAAQAQGGGNKADSLDKKLEALRAELREIKQALKKNQAGLQETRQLSRALQKKQADLERTATDLKKRAARIADALDKLRRENAASPSVFPVPNPPLKAPLIFFPPKSPLPLPPSWPPPWPPPGLLPPWPAGGSNITPLGTPGRSLGAPQSMLSMPGMMPQR
jgi:hypothetical protein